MATRIYKSEKIKLVDDTELEITPLKIKYLREFMDVFQNMKNAKNDDEAIDILVECSRIALKQFYPKLSKNVSIVEDSLDLPNVYKIVNAAGNIKIDKKSEKSVKDQANNSGETWDELDLVRLESEAFLLGIWKDYEELETNISMPELLAILSTKRELDYDQKKFFAAIQGIDLDKNTQKSNAWEDMKARVFSKGKATDSKDITALQGLNAQKAGFGIGMGLEYEDLTKK